MLTFRRHRQWVEGNYKRDPADWISDSMPSRLLVICIQLPELGPKYRIGFRSLVDNQQGQPLLGIVSNEPPWGPQYPSSLGNMAEFATENIFTSSIVKGTLSRKSEVLVHMLAGLEKI